MKRRFISILMALVMALSLLPAQALAEDNTVTELNNSNISNGLGNGTYKLTEDVTITSTLTITGDTTLDLNDHVLQMKNGSGSVFKIESTGHLTLEDNAATKTLKYFSKNNATDPWTLLTDSSTSAYSVSGGVITGGSAHQGGGVYIGGGTFAMTGGSIVGCAATHTSLDAWGGGVFVLGGQFNMTGGNIVGCTAVTQGGYVAHGGGVCISMGTFNMSGGSITDCTAAAQGADGVAWGGGICNYSNGITTLSGTAKIQNCHATGNKCYGGGICDSGKLNISGDVQITGCTAGGSSNAMSIFGNSSTITGGTFYGSIQDPKNKISGLTVTYQVNGADYATQVVPSGETATQPADPTVPADQTFDGWYKADGTEWNFTNDTVTESLTLTGWLYVGVDTEQAFTNALADNSIDVIRLMKNITITSTLEITKGRQLTLDLNDHVLQMTGGGRVFDVYVTGCLTLTDNAATKTAKYFDRNDITGLWSWRTDNSTSDYSVFGGVITGGSTNAGLSGGAILVFTSSTAIMNGGNIVGCSADGNGGAVLMNGGTFEMNSGAIIGCKASERGGAVYALGGTFTMTGGSIENCTAAKGEAIYLNGGTMNADGGTVSGAVMLGIDNNKREGRIQSLSNNTNATQFNGDVTNKGTISYGVFNGTVENTGTLTGGTYNGEVINNGTINDGVFTGIVSGNGKITGGTFNTPMTGSGTKNDPYQISTADQLKLFRDIVNGAGGQTQNRGAYAVLTANIDLNNEPWTPIGNYTEGNQIYYEGTFDGGGHTISGLNVTGKFRCASLFGAVKGGTIKNLTVAGNVSHNYNSTGLDCHVGGIVGSALDAATIENCSNNCSVTGGSGDFIGGIAGSNIDNARIIDCYNVGTITGTFNGTGGVTGINMGTISNCYNVGTVKGSHAVGEIVGDNNGTVENCYYLAGTNLNAVGQNNSNGNITKTESKTAANFANGTVLALLKADRDNSPWDSCQYVAAAKITLPVFKGQGDAHEHNGNWTSNGDGTHSRHCTCNAVETVNCSGGKATCTAKAVCEVCKAEYGEKLPHDFTAETVNAKYLKSAATCTEKAVYYKSCTVCGLSSKGTADEATFFSGNALGHDWGDWTPSSNKTHTRTCKTDSTHTETKNCADDNKDHVCDTCGATLTQHSGGTASCAAPATCGYCGKTYGEKNPANHSDLKHVPAKAATTQAEGNSEYWLCSGCGKCYKDAAAATEIALSDTVIAKRIPRRYSGPTITVMGAAYYDGGNVGLTFVSSADFDTFTGVQVDGKTLAAKNYIAERGSIEVYLKAVYLRTLKNGSHTVTIQSTAGDVSAVFTVENSKTSPGTSDPGVAVYALSSMLSLTGLAALRRRKED